MVEHAHIHQRKGRLEGLGQVFVGPAGLHRAAGVVVRQHHSGGLVVQGAHDHFTRVNAGLAQRPPKKLLQGQHAVLAVQKQHRKNFVVFVGQLQLQILFDGARCVKNLALFQALAQGTA